MEEENNCPKPNCGRPESTSRQHAGKRLSICGNGHSWDAQAIAEQRAKAKEVDYREFEIKPVFSLDPDGVRKRVEDYVMQRRIRRDPFE